MKIKVPDTVRIINEDLSVGLSRLSFIYRGRNKKDYAGTSRLILLG